MDVDDWYLLDINIHDLIAEPVDPIHGWLYDILTARGDIEAAKEEGLCNRRGSLAESNQLHINNERHF